MSKDVNNNVVFSEDQNNVNRDNNDDENTVSEKVEDQRIQRPQQT